jgi:hypothetical protein
MIELPQVTVVEHWKNMSLVSLSEVHEGVVYLEEWTEIKGYEGLYAISSFGRVKNLYTYNWAESIKAQRFPKNGYLLVSLWKDNKEKKKLVHRLVAQAFVPNPGDKRTVNHKKGIKTDNRYHQLEWATQGENAKHSYDELGRKCNPSKGSNHFRSKKVIKYDLNGKFVNAYNTVSEAAKSVNTSSTHISGACSGKYKIVKGFKWEYA